MATTQENYLHVLSEEEITAMVGPVIGKFTVHEVAEGESDHPEAMKVAWIGAVLPIRPSFYSPDRHTVEVYMNDAYNALHTNQASHEALLYWWDKVKAANTINARFAFDARGNEIQFNETGVPAPVYGPQLLPGMNAPLLPEERVRLEHDS